MTGDGSRPVIIHAAPVLCIQVPMLETIWAIQRATKNLSLNGVNRGTGFASGSVILISPRYLQDPVRSAFSHYSVLETISKEYSEHRVFTVIIPAPVVYGISVFA
jgi:hypothetical protein